MKIDGIMIPHPAADGKYFCEHPPNPNKFVELVGFGGAVFCLKPLKRNEFSISYVRKENETRNFKPFKFQLQTA